MDKIKLFSAMILLIVAIPVCWGQSAVVEDTLSVSGKAVVFFGPSQSEYLAMTHEQKDAVDEELYDFYHNRGEVRPFLASNAIQEFSTGQMKIQILLDGNQSITYSRQDFDRVVGLILTNGRQEPRILLGATAVADLIAELEDYFGLY
jgi:hypothetical protein